VNHVIESRRAAATSAALAAVLIGALAGCAAKDTTKAENPSGSSTQIAVDASDSACTLSVNQAGTGKRTFVITNNGSKVTEFYVYGKDDKVLAEAENISPGLQRSLDVEFTEPGTYRTACKAGMVGDGISTELSVSG
jgi:iron uptake system component EfeO